ncbi:hypothetical protein N7528_000831 [Penicillium herquei]|nr:hypothetical protein N7528_000831 [Penicillium herquei]
MTTETVETIAEVVQTCVDGLVECLVVAALMKNEWAENRLADLNLWISGTGALARGRASLDHRLATRPEVREVVLNSLRLLSTMIDECKEASFPDQGWQSSSEEIHDDSVDEPPVRSFSPWSDNSSSSSGSESADIRGEKPLPYTSPVEEAMYNVESIIDQLARLAVAIRRSGRRSRLQKADQLFKPDDHKELRDHLVTMFLHKLGFLKDSSDATDSSKLSDVQMRLIDCNLRRRNRFLYAQKHSQGLVPVRTNSQVQVQITQSIEISEKQEMKTARGSISSQKDVDVRTVTTLRTGTSASAMSASFLFPTADQMMPSASSSIMSSTVIDLDYPRPPKIMNASHIFRCPCCCESLPVAMANRNKWRKHVSDDLSPYSCVIAGCDKPSVLCGSKDTWRDHILRDHSSLTYWVCFACNDGRRFNSEQNFVEHTKLAHATSIPSDQIPVLMDLCKVTAPVEIHRCPLCNWPSEEEGEVEKSVLLDHIAKELHAFSLRSLPWADNNGQEMEQRIAWSSAKVCDWMIRNDIQSNPSQDPPRRDQRVYVSKYFEENDYFADSSGESGTSQAESEFSRAQELRKLKQVEGSSLGLSEEDGFDEHPTRYGTTRSEDSGSPDLDPAESSSDDLQNETSSTQNVQANELIQVKKEELGNIYSEHSISNADLEFLPRHRLQERRAQSPPRPAFNASVSEPYKGLDQLPWAIPQLTYTSYDSTLGGESQPETELDHGLDNSSQKPEAEFKAGPVYESWADFYIPEEIRLASGSPSLGEDANINYEIRSEDGDSSRVKAVPSDYSMEAQHHQDSQRRSHVSATSTELEIQPPILELNGMTLNFKEDDTSSIRTEMGSIQLDEGDGPNPTPDPRSPDSDVRKSPYSHMTGDSGSLQVPKDLQQTHDNRIDHLLDSHQSSQPWTIPELNVVPPPEYGDTAVAQSQRHFGGSDARPTHTPRIHQQLLINSELNMEDETDAKSEGPVVRSSPRFSTRPWVQDVTHENEFPFDDRPKRNPNVQPEERVPRRRERDSAGSANRPRRRPGVSFPDYDSFSDYLDKDGHRPHRPHRGPALEERPELRSSEMFSTGSKSALDLSPTASSHTLQGFSSQKPHEHEQRHTSSHGSQSSEEEASLENEGEEENRQHRKTQKATLAKALEKANSAVLLDNAANFEGAMQAYIDACQLLQLVIIRSRGGEEEKAKLQEIVGSPIHI